MSRASEPQESNGDFVGRRFLAGSWLGEARRVAPEAFEVVERAGFWFHDVDDDIEEVSHDPLAARHPIGVEGLEFVF